MFKIIYVHVCVLGLTGENPALPGSLKTGASVLEFRFFFEEEEEAWVSTFFCFV